MASNAQLVARRIAAWNASHPKQQLDAQAVLAVARMEGLGGGVGDQGTSFGPFQLHQGGALPKNISLKQGQAWAWSQEGIDYALSRIASVAGGQRGATAVANIVSRFERPANIPREIAGALRNLGLPPTSVAGWESTTRAAGGGAPAATDQGPDALAALLLSRLFQPPPVDKVGTTLNPVVHIESPSAPSATDALTLVRRYLDTSRQAFTNPGFAAYLHGMNGVALPSSTLGQSAAGSHTTAPKAGDLAFFGRPPSHSGVMLDSGHFLHGTNGGTALRITSLAHPAYSGALSAIRAFH